LGALVLRKLVAAAAPQRVVFSALGLREGYAHRLIPAEDRTSDPLIAAYMAVGRRQSRSAWTATESRNGRRPCFPTSRKRSGCVIEPRAGSAIWLGLNTPTTALHRLLPGA